LIFRINFIYNSPMNFYIDMPDGGWYLFSHGYASDITPEHVSAWMRFAQSRVTGRFSSRSRCLRSRCGNLGGRRRQPIEQR
jgi:hypothetical protein